MEIKIRVPDKYERVLKLIAEAFGLSSEELIEAIVLRKLDKIIEELKEIFRPEIEEELKAYEEYPYDYEQF